jgi:membrane protein
MNSKEFVTVAKATVKELGKDEVGNMAAVLTYYTFFSIFPILLLAISFASMFLKPQDATDFVFGNVMKVAPGFVNLLQDAMTEAFKDRNRTGWIALVGFATLIWSATGAFSALDKAINRAWEAEKVSSFIVSKLVSFAMLVGLALLFLVSVLASSALAATRSITSAVAGGDVPGSQIFWWAANVAVSLAIIFLAFAMTYRFLPRCDVNLRDVWPAALLAAIAWTIVKELFALYLGSSIANYSATYGTLGTVFALLTWIYLSSFIIMLGAEFSSETARVRRLRPKARVPGANELPRDEARRGESEDVAAHRKSPWLPPPAAHVHET